MVNTRLYPHDLTPDSIVESLSGVPKIPLGYNSISIESILWGLIPQTTDSNTKRLDKRHRPLLPAPPTPEDTIKFLPTGDSNCSSYMGYAWYLHENHKLTYT